MMTKVFKNAKRMAVVFAGASLLAATACSSSPSTSSSASTGVAHMTFWGWAAGIQSMVNLFNKTHKNIQVTLQDIPSGTAGGYAKMFAALKAGNAPCVAQVEYQEIPSFLVVNGLVNIKQYAEKYKSLFVPWQWQQGVFNGNVYSIPWASGPMGMYYRKDLFAKDGITSPPATWAQFAQDAAIIHHDNPNQYIASFPVDSGDAGLFAGFAWQAGARWFGTSGQSWTVNIDSAATRKVASFWQGLVSKGLVKTEGLLTTSYYKDLQDGNILSIVGPDWMDVVLEDDAAVTSGKWNATDLPQWSSTGPFVSANDGGSSIAVLSGCKYPAQATQFAVWWNSNTQSVNMSVNAGDGYPAVANLAPISALKNAPTVFKFYGGQDIYTVFTKADSSVNESWQWSPTISTTYDDLSSGFTSAVSSNGSFTTALAAVQQQTIASLKAKGLQVKAG